jgi:hypothetical protein
MSVAFVLQPLILTMRGLSDPFTALQIARLNRIELRFSNNAVATPTLLAGLHTALSVLVVTVCWFYIGNLQLMA